MPATPFVDEERFAGYRERVGCGAQQRHAHAWHVIGIPLTCPLTVSTDAGLIVVPRDTAVWMPAGVEHQATTRHHNHVSTIAIRPGQWPDEPHDPCILETGPFLRELVLHMSTLDGAGLDNGYVDRLGGVLSVHTRAAKVPRIDLRLPKDRRLRVITDALLEDVLDERTLQDWATIVGASYRTLARHFAQETLQTYQEWRSTLLAAEAVKRLAEGQAVCVIAADLGYASVTGFSAMFKRVVGMAPSEYLKALEPVQRRPG